VYQQNVEGIQLAEDTALHVKLRQLAAKTKSLEASDALTAVEGELVVESDANYIVHLTIAKSSFLFRLGRQDEGLECLSAGAERFPQDDAMNYFSGQELACRKRFGDAIHYLSRTIEVSETSNKKWYYDSALLLRSYCAAMVGNVALARNDLEKVEADASLAWLPLDPVVTKKNVENLLVRPKIC
jgi:hypothetical protein